MLQSLRLALSILALATIGLAPIIVTPGRAQDVTFSHPEADKDASAIEALVKALGKTGTGQQTGTKATTRPTRV